MRAFLLSFCVCVASFCAATSHALAQDSKASEHEGGFEFGSYGRVVAASNLRGGSGRNADIVAPGPRIDESTYAEVELRRWDRWNALRSNIVATLAIAGPLFHDNGEFDARIAVRNLYAEVLGAFAPGTTFWAGSRMVRGDDIYLLDVWPLDNLNLVGGGARYDFTNRFTAGLALGLARPNNPFYTQSVDVASSMGFVPESVLLLDRPRFVLSDKFVYHVWDRALPKGLKFVLYNELHLLSAGTRQTDTGATEALPSDAGYMVGAEASAYDSATRSFANVFVRYAQGLAAYDPLGIPFSVGAVIETTRARELRLGFSANWERGMFGVQAGGFFRYFRDADPTAFARSSLTEAVLVARPTAWFGEYAGVSLDLSYQHRETSMLDELTGAPVSGNLWKVGVIPFISPAGRGSYTRPHLRLIYSMTIRDSGARAMYPSLDVRSQESLEHFLGIGAEWWFNSSSYQ